MTKIKNNTDLVNDLMTFSPYGALCQGFIIQAIQNFSESVIKNKETLLKQEADNAAKGKISIVNHASWIGVAEDIKTRMEAFYNPES